MRQELVFLCGARDFHAMDWYRSAKRLLKDARICILTDLIESEGFDNLVTTDDLVFRLVILDLLLPRKQSSRGNKWRNALKAAFFPVQVALLKAFSLRHRGAVFYAHSMYYLWLAWAAGVPFIGTPQGSDILVKPLRSRIYKILSRESMRSAIAITVDSEKMKEGVRRIAGVEAKVIQNGIDIEAIEGVRAEHEYLYERNVVLSLRGLAPNYKVRELLEARNVSTNHSKQAISLVYPFYEAEYEKAVKTDHARAFDDFLGRLDRISLYRILFRTKLAISIPESDSSPRSVYEAIFCGAAVATNYHPFYETLPDCMKTRVILVDPKSPGWFDSALESAEQLVGSPFQPSEEAIRIFDQQKSFELIRGILRNNSVTGSSPRLR